MHYSYENHKDVNERLLKDLISSDSVLGRKKVTNTQLKMKIYVFVRMHTKEYIIQTSDLIVTLTSDTMPKHQLNQKPQLMLKPQDDPNYQTNITCITNVAKVHFRLS